MRQAEQLVCVTTAEAELGQLLGGSCDLFLRLDASPLGVVVGPCSPDCGSPAFPKALVDFENPDDAATAPEQPQRRHRSTACCPRGFGLGS